MRLVSWVGSKCERERAWPVIALFVLSVLVHAGIDRISPYTGGDGSLLRDRKSVV